MFGYFRIQSTGIGRPLYSTCSLVVCLLLEFKFGFNTLFNSVKKKLGVLFKMNRHELCFFLEAVIYIAAARFCVCFLPLKWYVFKLGSNTPDSLGQDNVSSDMVQLIRTAISRAANNVPWNTVCLPQAIAAKWMCQRRNIKSVLYLGVAKKVEVAYSEYALNEIFSKQKSISAHAWLKVEDTIITGKVGHKKFTVLKIFY